MNRRRKNYIRSSRAYLVALLIAIASQTGAQGNHACAAHDAVAAGLAAGYGETRVAVALGRDNSLVEFWANVETGSWTVTVTAPGGLTCLVASGSAFQTISEPLPTDLPT